MSDLSHIAVIYNPNSTGRSREKAEAFLHKLERDGNTISTELIPTRYAGHATQLAYDLAKRHSRPLIVSSSGDGGYNEVINGALDAQSEGATPVCTVIPAGNANDHRNTIGRRPLWLAVKRQAIDHIDVLQATITGTDGGVRRRHAHSYIGLGLTPAVAVELNRTSLSRLKEMIIVLRSIHNFHPVTVEVGGERLVVDSLIFANISRMAKLLTIADNARPDDGRFEVVIFPYKHKAKLICMLVKAVLRGIDGEEATRYEFSAVKDMPLQFDGEIVELSAGDEVRIDIVPKGLATLR
jgi:diacylglycerol kinase (ATP)